MGREAVGTACAKAQWQKKSKYSGGTGPAWPEEKEGPEMRWRSEGESSPVEMMLLTTADADPLPMEEFNTKLPWTMKTHFTEPQRPKLKMTAF